MDDTSVCPPQLAESDAQNNTTSSPNAASATDADTVINTKIDSAQVEGGGGGGGEAEEQQLLLRRLLTDDYCHVCEAVLLFQSQRLSHYEGKKHAQKLKVYLQAKKGERERHRELPGPQRTMTADKDRFCELCNMVFSSHSVARSHYEGKVHSKNLRKQGLQPSVADSPRPDHADPRSAPEEQHPVDPAAATAAPSAEPDPRDPNRHCALCAASFNNPQMALQHYNGRKHQRNQARQELMRELGDDAQQADSLMCQMCGVQFNSVEMYQAHMQGNKHQSREKKVIDLCKSQQKVYSTFADELADYIQVQRARGIAPKPQGDTQQQEEQEEQQPEEEAQEVLNQGRVPSLTPTSDPPHQSRPGCYYPAEGWRPPYPGPPWPPHGWNYSCSPPTLPALPGSPQLACRPLKRRRRRKQSSSSSYTTSSSSPSSSSSCSSGSSDSEEHRRRERSRSKRSRKERGRRARGEEEEEEDKEERRKKRQREERDNEESEESEQERRRKKQKKHGKQRRKEKRSRDEDFEEEEEEEEEEGGKDGLKPEDTMDNRRYTEVHIQAEINVEQGPGGADGPARPKYRKEKKKVKERVDTRTEEEKLWDDSILGC